MGRPKSVTFGSLAEGDYFLARGKFHCKESVGLFQRPADIGNRTYNAFYYDGPTGKWAHFDELVLVQRYNPDIHGQPADVIMLHERPSP